MMIYASGFCITTLLALASFVSVCGQVAPGPTLVDEFGLVTCEDLLARTQVLAADIQKDSATTVAIVIRRPKVHPTRAEARSRLISSTLQLRGIERDRFSFFLGGQSEDGEIRSQFWQLPAGTSLPATGLNEWKEPAIDASRPFIFGYENEIGICPTFVPHAFAKLILDNPGSRGHIVVTEGDDSMFSKFYFAEEQMKELVEKHGVPRQRLRLFFAKGKGLMAAEFWFVPARKK